MKEKLESLSVRWKELEEEIQDPALIKNQSRYKDVMREHAYLSKLMEEYAHYLRFEEEITQLRNLLEKVSMENSSPQSLPTENGKLRRLFSIGEWAMIVILCCTLFPLVAIAFLVGLLLGNFDGAMALVYFNLMAWPLVLIFWVLPIILFFVFRFIQKKTYSDEVIQINQLIYEELRVRKYIADEDLTEEARELKELYKRIWD